MIAKLGGRRFLLAAVTLLASTLLLWFGKLDSGGFVAVSIAGVCAYIAGDTYQRREEIRNASNGGKGE